ncbi:hypothetical protein WE348_20240 (plasmid) [Alteromonas macleodii]|uniref:hypothetical protein n=1 Tax=Alteromonas macleodii TaxID=28108 RepID=UPI0030CA7406
MTKTIEWTGDNAADIADIIDDHSFFHKNGILFIRDGEALVEVYPHDFVESTPLGKCLVFSSLETSRPPAYLISY